MKKLWIIACLSMLMTNVFADVGMHTGIELDNRTDKTVFVELQLDNTVGPKGSPIPLHMPFSGGQKQNITLSYKKGFAFRLVNISDSVRAATPLNFSLPQTLKLVDEKCIPQVLRIKVTERKGLLFSQVENN